MKKLILVLATLMALPALAACNTIEGVGEDVSAAGGAVSGAASETKDEISK